LITSTVLTLIVLPVVYAGLEERWPAWSASLRRRLRRDTPVPLDAVTSATRGITPSVD